MNNTTDPCDLIINGMLAALGDEGQHLFNRSVQDFIEQASDNPHLAIEVIGTIVDVLDITLEQSGLSVEERINYVRDQQDALRVAMPVWDEIKRLPETPGD
jgi:predicted metal-dependent phosphoesterase TrpH